MPDFQVRIANGTDNVLWEDPATPNAPTRLNPVVQRGHTYPRHYNNASMTVEAGIDSPPIWGPADGALGGRPFAWSWVATPTAGYSPGIPATPGFTSIVTFPALHLLPGHYELLCSRPDGGAVGLSFEVEGF